MLAQRVTKCTSSCDKALHRLVCYINTTRDLVLTGYVGDDVADVGLKLWADADFAGDRPSFRSTSGTCLFLVGKYAIPPCGFIEAADLGIALYS